MSVKITKHARKRLKERSGLNKKSIQRIADRAFEEGLTHKQTKDDLHRWISLCYLIERQANNIRIYGDKAFLFKGDVSLTVLQIPNQIKSRINHTK